MLSCNENCISKKKKSTYVNKLNRALKKEKKSKSPYSVRIRENKDQKKLRIVTLFTSCLSKS